MVESIDGRSRFVPYRNNAVRFAVDAFLFKGMTGQVRKDALLYVGINLVSPLCHTSSELCLSAVLTTDAFSCSSSTCTASCLWAVLSRHLDSSPATMTLMQEG